MGGGRIEKHNQKRQNGPPFAGWPFWFSLAIMPTMRDINITLPKLHSAQIQIKQEARRYNIVDCGRRWGKTTLGIDLVIEPALRGYPVGWFSPTYKNLLEAWRSLVMILEPVTKSANKQEHRIQLITGGILEMWSLDRSQNMRGRKYKRAIIDEAAIIPELEQTWGYVIRPTLTDYQGDAWFLSTPQGTQNYFYTLYLKGQEHKQSERRGKNWISWQMPTAANPHIKPEEIEEARQELPPHVFEQEYLAEFKDAPGGVIFDTWSDNDFEPGNVTEEADYIPGGGMVLWGADDGYAGQIDKETQLPTGLSHPRTFVLAQLRQDGRLAVFAESWKLETLANNHIRELIETCEANGWPMPDYVAHDSAAASLKGYLHAEGIQTIKGTHPVEEGIKVTRGFLAADKNGIRNTIVHPRCRLLRAEMKKYSRTVDPNGVGTIIKQFDHACDALRYLHYTLRER